MTREKYEGSKNKRFNSKEKSIHFLLREAHVFHWRFKGLSTLTDIVRKQSPYNVCQQSANSLDRVYRIYTIILAFDPIRTKKRTKVD